MHNEFFWACRQSEFMITQGCNDVLIHGPGRWLCGPPRFSITRLCLWTNVDLCCIFVHLALCTGAPQCGDWGGWDWFEGMINLLVNGSRLDGPDAASVSVRLPAMLMARIWTSLTFLWDALICYRLSESWRNMVAQTHYSGALTCKACLVRCEALMLIRKGTVAWPTLRIHKHNLQIILISFICADLCLAFFKEL